MQFSVHDAACLLGTSESQVERWIKTRALPAERVHGRYQINRTELIEWAADRQVDLQLPALQDSLEPDACLATPPTPTFDDATLIDALRQGGVHSGIPAADKTSALRAVVNLLQVPPGFERETLVQLFMAREALGTTAVGNGLALPHVRYPLLLPVGKPVLTVGYLTTGIDYGAADGRPVETLFVLICPTMAAHMFVLSRLAAALRDPGFLDAVRQRAPLERLLEALSRWRCAAANCTARANERARTKSLGA